jgi:hypothetical protein
MSFGSLSTCRADRVRLAHDAVAALCQVQGARGSAAQASAEQASAAERLHALIDEEGQDYSLVEVPSPTAVAGFGRVVAQLRSLAPPLLSLTPSGGIWAEWAEAARRSVAIFIAQDGRARIGAVLMVQEGCRLPLLLEMEGDIDTVLERLRSDRDLNWLHTEGCESGA